MILGIKMPVTREMSAVLYESKHNDSGFYERGYLLPQTGGTGTLPYTVSGCALVGGAAACLWLRHRKKSGNER